MEPITIVIAVVVVGIIGLLCAVMLTIASKFMAVEVDERIPMVRECLPGANCGACGFAGCDGYAAALVEEVCDRLEADIFAKYPGCYFPFRFSPGYGDLPLSVQSGLLTLLDAPRKIGLCANENHILTPRKSVTALIGVSREPVDRAVRSCQSCPGREGCQYRKSGGHCGAS